jgi:hypothetical protein
MNQNQLLRTIVRNQYMVSTVLLKFTSTGSPNEYETMVFKYDADADKVTGWLELDCLRAESETEAFINHNELCVKWGAPGSI